MSAEFRIGNGSNVVAFLFHFLSVEPGFDLGRGQGWEIDF